MRRMFLFLITCSAAAIIIAAFPAASTGQVLINEFMADPARDWDGDGTYDYRSDEWVEIINAGESPIDLSPYLLRDGAGGDSWRYRFAGTLQPGEVKTVYGSDAVAWEESSGFPAYGLSLNNTGDGLFLCRIDGIDTVEVDTAEYGRAAAQDDRSMGRSIEEPAVWAIYDALNPCGDSCEPAGNGCVPTPGAVNSCLTALKSVSWGFLKTMTAD